MGTCSCTIFFFVRLLKINHPEILLKILCLIIESGYVNIRQILDSLKFLQGCQAMLSKISNINAYIDSQLSRINEVNHIIKFSCDIVRYLKGMDVFI